MSVVVNKKMRRVELISGIFFFVIFILDFYGKVRSADMFGMEVVPMRLVYSVTDVLFPVLLIIGKYREKPWNIIGSVLLILSAVLRVRYVTDAYQARGYMTTLNLIGIIFCFVLLTVAGFAAALTILGIIRWRNRSRLLVFMYIIVPLSIVQVFALTNYIDIFCMFAVVLCLYHDNRHVNTKQGRTGRFGLYSFAVLRLLYSFAAYIVFILGWFMHKDLSHVYSRIMMASGVHIMFMYAMMLLMPQMLFDKQIGSDIVYGDMYGDMNLYS